MPSVDEHCRRSLERTGNEYRQMHEWADDHSINRLIRMCRHNILFYKANAKKIFKRFGEKAAKEYLVHIIDDYNSNRILATMLKLYLATNPTLRGSIESVYKIY